MISFLVTLLFVVAFISVVLCPSWKKYPDVYLLLLLNKVPLKYKREIRVLGWSIVWTLIGLLLFGAGAGVFFGADEGTDGLIPLLVGLILAGFGAIKANSEFRRIATGLYDDAKAEAESVKEEKSIEEKEREALAAALAHMRGSHADSAFKVL